MKTMNTLPRKMHLHTNFTIKCEGVCELPKIYWWTMVSLIPPWPLVFIVHTIHLSNSSKWWNLISHPSNLNHIASSLSTGQLVGWFWESLKTEYVRKVLMNCKVLTIHSLRLCSSFLSLQPDYKEPESRDWLYILTLLNTVWCPVKLNECFLMSISSKKLWLISRVEGGGGSNYL